MDNFKSAVSWVSGIHGVPIDYLLREVDSNYNDNWENMREKLSNFLSLVVNQFKHNSALL